jgi:uncharacterized membrane protein YozB (DUF420 family)
VKALAADLTLLAEAAFFLALVVGVIAQRGRRYKLHDWIQTPVVALNLIFIIFIMAGSFVSQRVAATLPQRPGDAYYLVVAVHAGLGLAAEGLAVYCLLAGHQILPRKFGRLRYWMWTTFGFWTAAVAFGAGTYYVWYVRQPAALLQPQAGEPAVLGPVSFCDHAAPSDSVRVLLDRILLDPGGSASVTFDQPGTYPYYCELHGASGGQGMAGTIVVGDAGGGGGSTYTY